VVFAVAGAPSVETRKLGRMAVGISCPASARKLAKPTPSTPGLSQESPRTFVSVAVTASPIVHERSLRLLLLDPVNRN